MRYWDEFNTKWGFADGECVPPDAVETREAYIRTINGLARVRGSDRRVAAYDRGGCHNPFLLLMITAKQFEDCTTDKDGDFVMVQNMDDINDESRADRIMQEILDFLAERQSPDQFVEVKALVRVDLIKEFVDKDQARVNRIAKRNTVKACNDTLKVVGKGRKGKKAK